MTTEATLAIIFGIMTLIATIAGIHYRDSLCCVLFQNAQGAWYQGIGAMTIALLH
ncbi:uncharacterized protein BDR25DRAFT_367207 [Lindgomyces ingoldianus]|uniref:Uncharacterized protein n=1 Tax=Lindgomyces ingoldianus TaxID=673940 RepID=A0ACB6QWY3_9PLEO|nr:uncharacterized protein BDR25DRAFT_367207 [Lindgomyces ingoldianus]KAF2471528.1 hypothetical protein BDR25DRAFT_367207 [Lindgomyces ingoldianus]